MENLRHNARLNLEILRQGASGIVYGRNIIQHPKPRQMTQALMAGRGSKGDLPRLNRRVH